MFETSQSLGPDGFTSNTTERKLGISLPLIFAIRICLLVVTHASAVLSDPDTFWHIVVGRWIIELGELPGHGIFSATMSNMPSLDQQWLAEILMAWGYDHFGWSALAAGTALCEALSIAIFLRVLLSALPLVYAMFAVTLAGTLCFPYFLARPFVPTIPILVVWVAAPVRARSEIRAPSPWLALLIALWANLHGSYLVGLGIVALLAAEAALLAPDWHARVRAACSWVASVSCHLEQR